MDPHKIRIHTHSFEEACEVVKWFESFGFRTVCLTPDRYAVYPYIFLNDEEIITGSRFSGGMGSVDYQDWKSAVTPIEFIINANDLFEVLGFKPRS